jgi:hypothetical protein
VCALQISHNTKMGVLVAAACVAAGAGAAFAVSKLHGSSASAATRTNAFQTGVIGRPGGFFAPRVDGFGGTGGLSAAAGYLGLTADELSAKLQSGQTLAQIAQATNGKSVSGLITAMTAAQKSELNAAVKAGRLTQAQADSLSAQLGDRITAMVNGGSGFRHGFADRTRPPGTPL